MDLRGPPAARSADGRLLPPPLAARCASMCLHGRAIDQDLRRVHRPLRVRGICLPIRPSLPGGRSDCREFCADHRPPAHRFSATGLQNLDNAADDPLIIDPRLAARIIRQKRFENSELILR